MRRDSIIIATLTIGPFTSTVDAAVTRYINKASWQGATGQHTTITFQEYPEHTLIAEQYASHGIHLTDGNDYIRLDNSFLNDGTGLVSSDVIYGIITFQFTQPTYAVACEFLGDIDMQLYANGEMIYQSNVFDTVQSRFGGLLSTVPFDMAVIRDPSDGSVNIDDLYFGPPIPAAGGLGLLGVALLVSRRSRAV